MLPRSPVEKKNSTESWFILSWQLINIIPISLRRRLTYPLALHRESISSMKIVLGAYALARSNKHRTMRSLSQRHLEAKVAEETLKKVVPHSVATPLARSVFPVPGGPNTITPFQGLLIPCSINTYNYNVLHSSNIKAYAIYSIVISKAF